MSTAETACPAMPGRAALRTARVIASLAAGTSHAERPVTVGARWASTTPAAAGEPYVQPSPVVPPAEACTATSVVASHDRVPSASGCSVGTV